MNTLPAFGINRFFRCFIYLLFLLVCTAPGLLFAQAFGPPIVGQGAASWDYNAFEQLGAAVNENGNAATYGWIEWGTSMNYENITAPALISFTPYDLGSVTLNLPVLSLMPDTLYHFRVGASNYVGTAYCPDATFISPGPPVITNQPQSLTNVVGSSVTFTVGAWSGAPLSIYYQWQKDGTNIASATASALTITNVQSSDAGTYVAQVYTYWEGGWYIYSSPAMLTVTPPPFFAAQASLGTNWYYLAASTNNIFGYYSLAYFPYVYHLDLGFEYFLDANNAASGAYFYDFADGAWWYSDPNLFPFLYDFSRNAWLYYSPDTSAPGRYTSNPRWFYDFSANLWTTNLSAH